MQLKRSLIVLAIFCGVLVVAIMGMYKSWNAFTSGGIFGMLSSKGIYWNMVDGHQRDGHTRSQGGTHRSRWSQRSGPCV